MVRRSRLLDSLLVSLSLVLVGPWPLAAQEGLGFRIGLGFQTMGAEWGRVLDGAVDSRFTSMYSVHGARFGVEWNLASFGMDDVAETSWNQTINRVFMGYRAATDRGVRPYAEIGGNFRRLHDEGNRFFDDDPPSQHTNTSHASGPGLDVALGLEVGIGARTALDLSGGYGWFSTDPDGSSFGLEPLREGSNWRAGLGVTWFPNHAPPTLGDSSPEAPPDPAGGLGIEPSRGLSVGISALTGIVTPWSWNTFLHDKAWTYVSPRSWWIGVTEGFAWDDNRFSVNHFRHPYHGSLFFNAARASGFGYWTGLLYSTVGSYWWECCTETHVASIPDMVTTPLGGAAVGEVLYRTSSLALDDAAVGSERVVRELMSALINPPRGLARLLTGRAWRTAPSVRDRPPEGLEALVVSGARYVVQDTAAGARELFPFLALDVSAGDLFGEGSSPFDYYRARAQFNSGDEPALGEIRIRGSLWRGPSTRLLGGDSRFVLFQDFDYINNWAFRYGAQAVTGAWVWEVPATERIGIQLRAEGSLALLGSVDSEFAAYADIGGIRESVRLYDFGFGPSVGLEVLITRDDLRWIEAAYRVQYLSTLNGSNIEGTQSRHLLSFLRLGLHQRVARGIGLGFDFDLFTQDSDYGFVDFDDTFEHHARFRFFASWAPDVR